MVMVMEGYEGGLVAIEGNVGLVAFGDDMEILAQDISAKVLGYFKQPYTGTIVIREFKDTVIQVQR